MCTCPNMAPFLTLEYLYQLCFISVAVLTVCTNIPGVPAHKTDGDWCVQKLLASLPSEHLPDICSTMVKASYAEKLQVLDAVDLTERFKKALPLLMRQIEVKWRWSLSGIQAKALSHVGASHW